MSHWTQVGLQDAAAPIIEEFIFFHDFAIVILTYILSGVGFVMVRLAQNSFINQGLLEGQVIECVWTLIPAVLLVQIAIPSLTLLYILDERDRCRITLKIVGHQWYWRYEFSDFWPPQERSVEFDSYIIPELELASGEVRLLDVDNRTTLPLATHVRALVRRADVLHSWTVPTMGVKADACPGRLNQIKFLRHRPGLFYGQCREICGANHSFMPIVLEVVPREAFLTWVVSLID